MQQAGECTDLQHFRGTHDHPGKQALLVLSHVLEQCHIAFVLDILLRQDKHLSHNSDMMYACLSYQHACPTGLKDLAVAVCEL